METREQLHQRVQRDQQLKARLRLATTRLADAEQERIWAIVAAHQAGLSIRQIAAATGLSRSRIHQLLQADEAREIPTWLSHLRTSQAIAANEHDAAPPPPQTHMQARVAEEVEVLRWCLDWLARLERGEQVKPRQNIVYLSAELNRLCRIRVSTDISIRDLSPVSGLILPLYSVVAHRNATSRVQSI